MNWKRRLHMLWGVAAGNALLALGVNAFYLPNGLAVGGSTGVGIILYRLWGLDPSMTVLVINTALLVLGWLVVGKEFVVSSVLGSYLYPMFLKLFQGLPLDRLLPRDPAVSVLCAGLLVGAGVGLTLRVGSSTGGSDTLAVICNRVFHVPVLAVKVAADYGVMLLSILLVSPDSAVYSLLALGIETVVMNRVMLLGRSQLQLLVITGRHEEVREMLLRELETGVTMLQGETGLRRDGTQVVLCVIPNKKLYAVKERIHSIDPGAFVTVAEVKEVRGQGFSLDRVPQPMTDP